MAFPRQLDGAALHLVSELAADPAAAMVRGDAAAQRRTHTPLGVAGVPHVDLPVGDHPVAVPHRPAVRGGGEAGLLQLLGEVRGLVVLLGAVRLGEQVDERRPRGDGGGIKGAPAQFHAVILSATWRPGPAHFRPLREVPNCPRSLDPRPQLRTQNVLAGGLPPAGTSQTRGIVLRTLLGAELSRTRPAGSFCVRPCGWAEDAPLQLRAPDRSAYAIGRRAAPHETRRNVLRTLLVRATRRTPN